MSRSGVKKYSPLFKKKVLASLASGMSQADAATKFKIGFSTIQRWARASKGAVKSAADRRSAVFQLAQLRDENQRLKLLIADLLIAEKNSRPRGEA